ncbi:hypothetical protein D8Z79_005425 [Escherichia fergusonii]|nr:hypothetical protein D8Z79_005425 [Escherichia fergusonii]
MGHKILLPVDVVLIRKFMLYQRNDSVAFLINYSGICSRTGEMKNCFSVYRQNAVAMTAHEAQFKRL